ncbi:protein NRT1/ PTR FAMILY 2.7-like [Salvia miltiorrhiza]|uniref:protein NRT1/ PTR FAMILY 2.7-like n=1 Tax=Salvia miltiorrhiza TaxID=226208 RepID=UPI0025ACE713|nr:protein NRT1/ PTR FAMILY 2.7-like [Salvia miltiorrhiza]
MRDKSAGSMDEAARLSRKGRRGGWITFPFIIGTMGCLALAAGGWTANLIVYLIQEFNIKSISSAKIYNFVNGSITLFPIVGAVIADSFLGCYSVICFSSLISLLGTLVLVLTAVVDRLRPPACEDGSNLCKYPSHLQFGVLYIGLALASLGNAGTRFTIATMGADQFDSPKHRGIFFNWYIFTMYTATIVSSTAIVYVEDNLSWTWGFTICAVANVLGLALLLSGRRSYRLMKPQGSPFTSLVRVAVAALSKRKMTLSDKNEDYYQDSTKTAPTHFFRFLNRAALQTEGDKAITVMQVEELKGLIKLFPLWSTGLSLCIPLAIQLSLTVIQALTMDRHLGGRFKIPAGSMPVFILASTSLSIFIIDRVALPLWERLTTRPLTLLQRIGIGHALTIASMAVSAAVERKRLRSDAGNDGIVAMSAMWLVPQLGIAGLGEAFHFPGQIALYYQEFPNTLKTTATAAVALFIGIAFYCSNGIIDVVRSVTAWLPDDINDGRLDNLYWLCCILGAFNFCYFLVCASFYSYKIVDESGDDSITT